jgi:hypothetical protein
MKTVIYTGDLWSGHEIHPYLLDLITSRDMLVEITFGDYPYHLTIGVPHHSAVGEEQIAENWWNPRKGKYGRVSDEGAASYALVAFSSLRDQGVPCKLVIISHASDHDPNKTPGCPYWEAIFSSTTRLLFECHGAGNNEETPDLELSAGNNTKATPVLFGRVLAKALGYQYSIAAQLTVKERSAIIIGEDGIEVYGKLKLGALETESLIHADELAIPALHLEANPIIMPSRGMDYAWVKQSPGRRLIIYRNDLLGRN